MGFKAIDAFEPLEYDFRPYADLVGTTPEPSDEDIRQMMFALQDASREKLGVEVDMTDPRAMQKALSKMSNEDLAKIEDDTIRAVVIVTKTSPSYEQLVKLPARVKRHYLGYLMGELTPPAGIGGTTA